MQIEMGKKYRTKGGLITRRVLRIDGLSTGYPVAVEMEDGVIEIYTAEGVYDMALSSSMDLVEIPEWYDFKLDAEVMVRNNQAGVWFRKHFAGVNSEGKPTTYTGGRTSHTEAKGNIVEVWDECRKPTEGGIGMNSRTLVEKLTAFRYDRPSEWLIDEYIREATTLEAENAALKAKFAELQKQEPVAFLNLEVWRRAGSCDVFATPERAFDNQDALYAQPATAKLAILQPPIEEQKSIKQLVLKARIEEQEIAVGFTATESVVRIRELRSQLAKL